MGVGGLVVHDDDLRRRGKARRGRRMSRAAGLHCLVVFAGIPTGWIGRVHPGQAAIGRREVRYRAGRARISVRI